MLSRHCLLNIGFSAADPTQCFRASGLAQMSRDRRAGERNRQRNPQFLHAIRRQTRRRCGPGIRLRRGDLSTFSPLSINVKINVTTMRRMCHDDLFCFEVLSLINSDDISLIFTAHRNFFERI